MASAGPRKCTRLVTRMSELTQEKLKSLLYYDHVIGIFTWLKSGKIAGNVDSHGYWRIGVANERHRAHRLVWLYVYGEWPKGQIDHINGIKTDNSIKNLRCVSNAENGQNINNPRTRNVSGLLGVCYDNRHDVYYARIMVRGKQLNLGTFKTAEEAHEAYLKAKNDLHPTWNKGFAEKHHGIGGGDE